MLPQMELLKLSGAKNQYDVPERPKKINWRILPPSLTQLHCSIPKL